jgi:hypothetical protein
MLTFRKESRNELEDSTGPLEDVSVTEEISSPPLAGPEDESSPQAMNDSDKETRAIVEIDARSFFIFPPLF